MPAEKPPRILPIAGGDLKRIPSSVPSDVVLPNVHACAYLRDRTANLPLVLCKHRLSGKTMDEVFASGMRRAGVFLYFAACEGCCACEPTRVKVDQFIWTRSWNRILSRGDRMIQCELGPTVCDEEHLMLFNRHRSERNLGEDGSEYGLDDYESFLVESCCEQTKELRFYLNGQLVAVSVIDFGDRSVSAVYTYFDPDYSKLSIGTYSILKQIELCLKTNRKYLYLGMYVAENPHLSYKARFGPQQRWVHGSWIDIDKQNR